MAEAPTQKNMDYILLLVALCLTGAGLVMVYSSSSFLAEKRFGDAMYFFKPQLIAAFLGVVIMTAARYVPYKLLCKLSYPLLLITIVCLALVLVPGIGHKVGGASRWLKIAGRSFQPSEMAKIVLVVYLAYSLAAKQEKIKHFSIGVFPHLIILGALVLLIVAEPDLGTAVTMTLITFSMFFVAGVRVSYLIALVVLSVPIVYGLIVSSPYRLKRMEAYLSPWDDPLGAGYHIIHSFLAFATGGLTGVGPGGSQQKLFFLPEPHTDFILSVLGEEFGFLGVAVIALLFLVLIWRGLRIAMNAYELEGTYLALGMTLIIGVQAFLNMAVVVGLLPTKGLALPFFSYGGSAMLVNFACIGVLLNVSSSVKPSASPRNGNVDKEPRFKKNAADGVFGKNK